MPNASATSWPWAHVSINLADTNDITPIGGPYHGTRRAGSATVNARTIPPWARSHQIKEPGAVHGPPPVQMYLHRVTRTGHGQFRLFGELLRLVHGLPAAIVEEGQMADLVPYRPALSRGGHVPTGIIRPERGYQPAGVGEFVREVVEELGQGSHARRLGALPTVDDGARRS